MICMELQPIINKLSTASNILILTQSNNGDSLAASLALRSFLKKLEKDAIVLVHEDPPSRLQFLPESNQLVKSIDLTKTFVISLSTKKTQLSELSYKKEPEQLSILLKPTTGEFGPADVTFGSSNFQYDLVILVGIPSLEQLGEFYNKNTELFFQVPVLNIDFRPSNENYGQMNLVDLTATSCSEIVLDLINKFESSLLDETIATQLLTGIITETNSFQHVRTSPQIFLKASQLVSLGAKQQEIISYLYKSKSLGLLKLWGRVLARLKQDFNNLLVYSVITNTDLIKAGASDTDADMIIKEMVGQLGFAKIFGFLKEEEDGQNTEVFVATTMPLNLSSIFTSFNPENIAPQTIKFVIAKTGIDAEKQLLELLKPHVII